jgi:GxxExxY protein
LKVASQIESLHQAQAISYLKVTDADLAFVVNFGQEKVTIQRLPNFVRDKVVSFVWEKQVLDSGLLYPELVNELLSALHTVHFTLGPGFLPQVYRRSTMVELEQQAIGYEYIKTMPIFYEGIHLMDEEVRLLAVEGQVLLATLAVRGITEAMRRLIKVRMRYLGYRLGMVANFHGERLETVFVWRDRLQREEYSRWGK